MISQGEIWWAAMPEPVGSGPGFERPVVVMQGDTFNRSHLATVTVVPLTTNLRLADMPGNLLVSARKSHLPKDSVANVTQVITLDRSLLTTQVGKLTASQLEQLKSGLELFFDLG